MRTQKTITIITVVLLVAIITAISFVGIYIKEEYRVSNIVKDYTLGMEFTDSRVVSLEVDKEENSEEVLTVENYEKTETIIKNRLKKLKVDQYNVVLDKTNGNIQIRIPENEDTDLIIYNLVQSGTFELKDSETEEILLDINSVKNVDVVYSQGETETAIFLQIKFNKDVEQKLEEISKIYSQTETEENKTEEDTKTKSMELYIDGQLITEIDPKESIMNDSLYIGVGSGSDSTTLDQYRVLAEETAIILNSGVLPIIYTETDNVEASKITTEQIKMGIYVALGAIALITIIFVIGLKTKGLLAAILQIGFIASLLLTLRYTNVKITIEGICGIVLASIINFVYIYKGFKNADLNFVKDITGKFALRLIPVYIIAIILSFNRIANIYSLGMTLVWGIIVMYLYNLTATQITIKALKK